MTGNHGIKGRIDGEMLAISHSLCYNEDKNYTVSAISEQPTDRFGGETAYDRVGKDSAGENVYG